MQKRAKMVITATMIALMIISQFFFQYGEKAFCATPAEIQEWLDAHNAYRALHGVPPVTWSATVAASAQVWADTCPSGHSSSGYGENMAFAGYVMSPTDVVGLWYSEEPLYPYGEPAWNPAWGHFTQVVWKGTTQIGCGYRTGCGGSWANVWVCQYNPPGNYIGQFEENVLPPQVGRPASITVPASSITGSYTVSWGASSTSGVTYVLQEATNSSFSSGLRTTYSGASTSTTITGRSSGTTYYYRVKATKSGYTDSDWRTGSNGCVVTITPTAGTPSSITVPLSDGDGSYIVSWGSSSTSGVTYVLEEATNSSFSSGLRTAYSGASTSTTITGRSSGITYYYRVKATKSGYTDSAWRTSSNGCAVSSVPLPVTENFNASTLPTGWTTQNIGTDISERWSVSNTANAGGLAYEMKYTWQSVNPGETRLITPCINTLGMDQITLSFRHFLDAYIWATGPVNLRVQTSNDKSTWTNTGWSVAPTSSDIGPATVNVTITTNLNSSTTYIAFVVEGNLYQIDYWYIDNVSIRVTIQHVSKDGICGNKRPCYTTIQAAVTAAKDGDSVKVSQGTYNEAPVRSTTGTVTIKGGWNSTFTSQTGTTEMRAPGATGGGGLRVQPNVRVIAP